MIKPRLVFGIFTLFQIVDAIREDDYSQRENRFPSVDDRVKLYMSNWYVPPCPGNKDDVIRYEYANSKTSQWPLLKVHGYTSHPALNETIEMELDTVITPDMVFYMDKDTISNCANPDFDDAIKKDKRERKLAARVKFRANMRMYCHDIKNSFLAAWNHIQWEDDMDEAPPVLLQFGDNKDSHIYGAVNVPIFKKFRSSYSHPSELEKVTSPECYSTPREILMTMHDMNQFQPIVWKLATHRHFDKLYLVSQSDTPWNKKRNAAIFRGQLTGSRDGYDKTLSDEENCLRLKRCRLVYSHANSTLIDASLTSTRGRLPNVLNGVPLLTKKIDLNDMLAFKGIIMIEGNDVASGLKWALLSQSVVLMPPPKHTSWAMEELLKPWVVSRISFHRFCSIFTSHCFHKTVSHGSNFHDRSITSLWTTLPAT